MGPPTLVGRTYGWVFIYKLYPQKVYKKALRIISAKETQNRNQEKQETQTWFWNLV